MSNRSKKNIFVKEANDTLKRILISPEYRNHIMELITGIKPKNGKVSLEWSLTNTMYQDIENECNNELAEFISNLGHEIVARLKQNVMNHSPATKCILGDMLC